MKFPCHQRHGLIEASLARSSFVYFTTDFRAIKGTASLKLRLSDLLSLRVRVFPCHQRHGLIEA